MGSNPAGVQNIFWVFFFFLFPRYFYLKASRLGGKGVFFAIVVLFHTTFVDTRTSVERQKKMASLEDAQKIFIFDLTGLIEKYENTLTETLQRHAL